MNIGRIRRAAEVFPRVFKMEIEYLPQKCNLTQIPE
jgi:hypothetical protein